MSHSITIVGGGLAGLTLGILLRRANVPVTVFEAMHYPRHRVCGEFISGAGVRILCALELDLSAAIEAHRARFFLAEHEAVELALPEPALCISRFKLDALLAVEFQKCGGELRAGERFSTDVRGEGIVRASGRRRAEPGVGHLIGLKAHALNPRLDHELEMHFKPNHYVGICRLAENRANVCGLFYSDHPLPKIQERWRDFFLESVFARALENVEWDEASFCAVAGLTLEAFNLEAEFCVGDAAAMIPPLTGNGMSMAFESATMAASVLERYSKGRLSWSEALSQHASHWSRQFARRLRWARWTQRLVFTARGQKLMHFFSRLSPALPRLLFSQTR